MSVSQARIVARFEVVRTFRKPQFWVAALLLPVLMAGVVLIMAWSGTSKAVAGEPITFEYSDASGIISEAAAEHLGGRPASPNAEQRAKSGELSAFLKFPANPTTEPVTIVAADRGLFGNADYSRLASALFAASVDEALGSERTVALVRAQVSTTLDTYIDGQPAGGIGAMLVPGMLAVLLILIVSLLGNQMLNSTVEEKENRLSEMLLVSLPARALIHGKIIALALLGLVQIGIVLIAAAAIFAFAAPSMSFDELGLGEIVVNPVRVTVGVLLLLGGLLTLLGLLVLTGAAMPSAKDAAPYYSVVVIVTIAPFYFITTILHTPDSPMIAALTYFPLTAPMTALMLNATGALNPWLGTAIAAGLLLLGALILRVAVSSFQRGVIQYDRPLRPRDLISNSR